MARYGQRVWPPRLVSATFLLVMALFAIGAWLSPRTSPANDSTRAESPYSVHQQDPSKSLPTGEPPQTSEPLPAVDLQQITPDFESVLTVANAALERVRALHDYQCILVKQERIDGKLQDEQQMELKIMHRPGEKGAGAKGTWNLSAYLKFLEPSRMRGREVIWISGNKPDRIIVHESGFLNVTRLQLDPTGRLAMLGNKYSIHEIGLERLLVQLIDRGNLAKSMPGCRVQLVPPNSSSDPNRLDIQVLNPNADPKLDFTEATISFDRTLQLPVAYSASRQSPRDPQPLLLESYRYQQLRINVGLTPRDFDPDNPAYQYP